MMQEEEKATLERIADALEERNEMFRLVGSILMYGIIGAGIGLGLIMFTFVFGSTIYGFFYYDVLGNERFPSMGYAVPTQADQIDDCTYSEDKQLCYQMKRVADELASQNELNGDD